MASAKTRNKMAAIGLAAFQYVDVRVAELSQEVSLRLPPVKNDYSGISVFNFPPVGNIHLTATVHSSQLDLQYRVFPRAAQGPVLSP